ncbi:MAG: CRISPR-associated endonuclease Cas2 [Leptospiraceae bacterium]|nr:CRISPR-associated endonuclease Cas2 [Leptospiraceae bacterium]
MKGVSQFAVIYDISSNQERRKVEKILLGFGFREQKSVFECTLDRRGRDELIGKLSKLDIQTGFIKIYRLEYSQKSRIIGKKEENGIDQGNAFIV